jgi:hypothetical protein
MRKWSGTRSEEGVEMNRRTFLGRAGLSAGGLLLATTVPDLEPVRRFFFLYPRIQPGLPWWIMSFPEVREFERFSMLGGGSWRLLDAATHQEVARGRDSLFSMSSTPALGPFPEGLIVQADYEPIQADFSYPATLRCGMADLLRFAEDEQQWRGNVASFVHDEYARSGAWLAEQPAPALGSSLVGSARITPVPKGHLVHAAVRGTVPLWLQEQLRSTAPPHANNAADIEEKRAMACRTAEILGANTTTRPLRPE